MKRALLAEDDPVNRAFLCEALALLGWQVQAFESGEHAAKIAIAQHFDALILDLNLPGADGIATLRHIRNLDTHASADAPALALTADTRPELHHHLRQNGFDAVAAKPLSIQQLSHALAGLGFPIDAKPPDSTDTDTTCPGTPPVWDDTSALAALAGNAPTLTALRGLMLADLPSQRDRILAAPHTQPARDELHRLRAACGFCGAALLAQAVIALEREASEAALAQFVRAVEQTLATAP